MPLETVANPDRAFLEMAVCGDRRFILGFIVETCGEVPPSLIFDCYFQFLDLGQ